MPLTALNSGLLWQSAFGCHLATLGTAPLPFWLFATETLPFSLDRTLVVSL